MPVEGARVEAVAQVSCAEDPSYPGYPGRPDDPAGIDPPPCFVDRTFGADDTDTSGAFAITNLPAGYFAITASKDTALVSEGVYVRGDSTVAFTLLENPSAAARTAWSKPRQP
jgi:hypothetical protein